MFYSVPQLIKTRGFQENVLVSPNIMEYDSHIEFMVAARNRAVERLESLFSRNFEKENPHMGVLVSPT